MSAQTTEKVEVPVESMETVKEKTKEDVQQEMKEEMQEEMQRGVLIHKMEQAFLRMYQLTDIIKEYNEEKKMLKEDIHNYFLQLNLNENEELDIPLGEEFIIKLKEIEKKTQKLDKDALSQHVNIPKEEFKSPWDFAKLAEDKKLASTTITDFTFEEKQRKLKMSKKKKPKGKKKGKKTV